MTYFTKIICTGLCFFAFSKPVFSKTLEGVGVDLISVSEREEVVLKEIFQCMKIDFNLRRAPFGRHLKEARKDQYDFVTTVPKSTTLKSLYSTKSHFNYINGVITLDNEGNKDLSFDGKKLISFIGASDLIPYLKKIRPKLKDYSENSKQKLHIKMLAQGRVDMIVADAFIFEAYLKDLINSGKIPKKAKFKFHYIFNPSRFSLAFKKKKHRDSFNGCVDILNKEGILKRLNDEYMINLIYKNISF